MIKLTEQAKEYIDSEEIIKFKVLGMYEGKLDEEKVVSNGIFVVTNKRLIFCNKKHVASFKVNGIQNVEFIEKKLNSPTITFQYNNDKISIKYIDQGDVEGFFNYLKLEQTNNEKEITPNASENTKTSTEKPSKEPKNSNELNDKKPIHKRPWVWIVAALLLFGFIGNFIENDNPETEEASASIDKEENKDKEDKSPSKENKSKKKDNVKEKSNTRSSEEEQNEDSNENILSNEDLDYLEDHLKESLEDERDFGDEFYLEKLEYDGNSNKISARIDMQQDPLPETKEDVSEWAETWSWSLVETSDIDKTFNVRVTLVTKIEKDEYILWGHSNYDADKKEYSFKKEKGMEIYDK